MLEETLTVFLTAIFAKFSCATTGTGTLMPFHITCSLQATHSTIIVEELAEFEALPSKAGIRTSRLRWKSIIIIAAITLKPLLKVSICLIRLYFFSFRICARLPFGRASNASSACSASACAAAAA